MNSDYSVLADVANQERIREYDYGPGLGGSVEVFLQRRHRAIASARYRYSHIVVSNGSIYNGEVAGARLGLDADHDIHQVQLKLDVPITRSLSVGADGSVFLRRSRYDVTESDFTGLPPGRQTVTQRNPEIRAYVAWTYTH